MCNISLSCSDKEYKSLTMNPECPAEVWVYLACALFFLGLYKEAEEAASKGRHFSRVHLLITPLCYMPAT